MQPEVTQGKSQPPKPKVAAKRKIIATAKAPIIQAVIEGNFRFTDRAQALKKLAFIKDRFVKSRHMLEMDQDAQGILWVKGFDVTTEEANQGALGNFMLVVIDKEPDGKFKLIGKKLNADVKFHPSRKRPKRKHPDWGDPILRKIKKKWRYDSVEAANKDLQKVAEDYPDVSIPCTNKLYTILYRKAGDGGKPIKKYVFEVKTLPEGGFFIDFRENNYVPSARKPAGAGEKPEKDSLNALNEVAKNEEFEQQKGYFASMVELKRSRKKKPKPTA